MSVDLTETAAEMRHFSKLLDEGLAAVRRFVHEHADAERNYRKAKAEHWVKMAREDEDGRPFLAREREAMIDSATADLRYARDVADGMRQAALESVRSRRGQLSSCQTMVNLVTEEMRLARGGPRMEP